jgi:hypothetical protein
MTIELFWDDTEETVMLAEFSGKWSWEELHKVLSKIKQISQERQQAFGAILDLRRGLHLPNMLNKDGLEQFQKLLALNDGASEKGRIVVLGMNRMVKVIFDAVGTFDKSLTNDVFFAENEDEARRLIYARVKPSKQ